MSGATSLDRIPKTFGPSRIALCHHETDASAWLRAWLTRDGLEVHQASDTIELLDLLAEGSFDAVVTSIDPEAGRRGELDGLQVLQMCRSAGLSVPFVLLSDEADLRMFQTITAVRHAVSLRAPFSPFDLVRILGELGRTAPRRVAASALARGFPSQGGRGS